MFAFRSPVPSEEILPTDSATDPEPYDAWFRAKVHEALADTRPGIPHEEVMDEAQALIDRKRRTRS